MSAADSWPDLPPGDSLAPVDWHCVYVVVSGTDVRIEQLPSMLVQLEWYAVALKQMRDKVPPP